MTKIKGLIFASNKFLKPKGQLAIGIQFLCEVLDIDKHAVLMKKPQIGFSEYLLWTFYGHEYP